MTGLIEAECEGKKSGIVEPVVKENNRVRTDVSQYLILLILKYYVELTVIEIGSQIHYYNNIFRYIFDYIVI